MGPDGDAALSRLYTDVRGELHAYLCRLVIRPALAAELVQTTFVRALEHRENRPADEAGLRAWLFRVATNLAFDALRKHSHRRESLVQDLRAVAEADPAFVEQSAAQIGSPETKAIAREHLVACFACTLRNLPETRAAALLLKEVHGFSLDETAELLDARPAQVKNWLHEARDYMNRRYADTCALIGKRGVCYQCVELDTFFGAGAGNPLLPGGDPMQQRLDELVRQRGSHWNRWHRALFALLDELL